MAARNTAQSKNTALAKRPVAELVPAPLPTSAETIDGALVDRAVSHIREVLASTVARGMDEIGRFLLHEFYGDDPELYFSANPNKHASLRTLIERCESMELPISRTLLGNALRVAAVTKQLPRSASFNRLPPSHRVELVRLRESDQLQRVADKALEGELTVQKLRALIKKEEGRNKSTSKRGRKPVPEVVKAIENCLRAVRDADTGKLLFRRADVAELNEEQHARAATALNSLEKRIAELSRFFQ
jgi:hypothetical protein